MFLLEANQPTGKQYLGDHTDNGKTSNEESNEDLDTNVPIVGCEFTKLELIRTLGVTEDTLIVCV